MVMALNPASRKLAYIDNLAPDKETADAVKRKVYSQLQARAALVIKLEREGKTSSGGGGGGGRLAKQPKAAQLPRKDVASERSDFGVMDMASDEEYADSDKETTEEEAEEVINEWRNAKFSVQDRSISDGDELALFWRTKGRKSFRVMSVVARSVLGAPGSAAVLEWDFGEAGQLVNSKRGSLGHAYVEMVMLLRGTYEHIPPEIPCLSPSEVDAAIPERLRDPMMRQEVADMCVEEEKDEEKDEEEEEKEKEKEKETTEGPPCITR